MPETPDTYTQLINLLDQHHATYRLINHAPEGQTDLVSGLHGHHPSEAAKCIIIMVKIGKKITKYVLTVVPGDQRVNLDPAALQHDTLYFNAARLDRSLALQTSDYTAIAHPRVENIVLL